MGNKIPSEKMQYYKDLTRDKFDERQIARMYRHFYAAAPSGKMKKKDFKHYVEGLGIFKLGTDDTYDHLFRGYDLDHDGTITFRDFLQYHLGIVFSTDELFDIIFSMYDVDGNGYITRDELIEVVDNATRWMDEINVDSDAVQATIQSEVDRIIALVDVNHDGQISKEELYAATEKHPEILEKLKRLA